MFKGIIALDDNRCIGNGNSLPWPKEKGDLKFFKTMTWGDNIIFGRKTFESLGGQTCLPNRQIYVMTKFNYYGWSHSEVKFTAGNGNTFIIEDEKDLPKENFWICGGKSIFEHFMPKISDFYVTYIKGNYKGNIFMSEFESQFPNSKEINNTDNYKTIWYWK